MIMNVMEAESRKKAEKNAKLKKSFSEGCFGQILFSFALTRKKWAKINVATTIVTGFSLQVTLARYGVGVVYLRGNLKWCIDTDKHITYNKMNWTLGLNFYSSKVILFNPSDLENEPTTKQLIESDKYHIYLICKRKKIFYESCVPDGTDFCKTTLYYLNDRHEKVYLPYRHPSNLIINSHENGFYNIDCNGQKNLMIRDFGLINHYNFLEKDKIGTSVTESLPSDLEVMYIGQSFGRTALRKIDYRLENHDKMQKIALQILNSGSNEEVLIVGLKVEVHDLGTSFVSLSSDTKKVTEESLLELQKKASERIPEGQELTVFEASLINYFRPKLNTEYKDTFPKKGTTSYNELYNLSFDYSSMTIDTKPVLVRIYSDFIKERKYIHNNYFPLTSESDKETLFEYLYEINNK